MKMLNGTTSAVCLSLAMIGCLPGEPSGGGEMIGKLTVDLTLAPTDARCVVITATPQTGTPVTRQISVAPQQSTVFSLSGLPTGVVTLTEQAFTQACSAIAGQAATWVSDPVTVTLEVGAPVTVSFILRRTDSGGQVTAVSDFPAPPQTFRVFPGGGNIQSLTAITTGSDGNLWFTDQSTRVGRLTTTGNVTVFTLPSGSPQFITAGPDGALWFTVAGGGAGGGLPRIGRITTSGALSEFPLPTVNAFPFRITAGADGNLWFVESSPGKIGRITTSGVITEFTPPTANSLPEAIAAGPDGNLWFTEQIGNRIGRVTPAGVFTEFTIPTASSGADGITAGPDGNLWFTETTSSRVGRITPTGAITEFAIPTANGLPRNITAGPDGNVWFTEQTATKVGRVTPAGVVTEIAAPDGPNPSLFGITAGPDGNLWYVEQIGGNFVQIDI